MRLKNRWSAGCKLSVASALLVMAASAEAVEKRTPLEWIPKLVEWNLDADRNFVEDAIDNMDDSDEIPVILGLNTCLEEAEIAALLPNATLIYAGKYTTLACFDKVRVADAKAVALHPHVAMVSQDHIAETMLATSIPTINVDTPAYTAEYPNVDGSGVRIAILDTGLNENHEMFAGQVDHDSWGGGFSTTGQHGTHVAGIALGRDAGTGLRGAAKGANLYEIAVLTQGGGGTESRVIQGVEHAIDQASAQNIRVLNMSLGFCNLPDPSGVSAVSQAVNTAVTTGDIVAVVAMGNTPNCGLPCEGARVVAPASAREAITVAATYHNNTADRSDDEIAWYSLRGLPGVPKPDVAAPGSALSAFCGAATGIVSANFADSDGYIPLFGTSMASPHVAGIAALMRQFNPSMTARQITAAIRSSAVDIGPPGFDSESGFGYVDALAAVQAAEPIPPGPGPTDVGFEYVCGTTYASPEIIVQDPDIVEGVLNRVTVRVSNFGPRDAEGVEVMLDLHLFGGGAALTNIGSRTLDVPANSVRSVTFDFTPVLDPGTGTVHGCLHSEVSYSQDTDRENNCTWRNIDIQRPASPRPDGPFADDVGTDGVRARGAGALKYQVAVVNPFDERIQVVVEPRFRTGEDGWSLDLQNLHFEMDEDECPVVLKPILTPGEGHGPAWVDLQFYARIAGGLVDIGGASIVGQREQFVDENGNGYDDWIEIEGGNQPDVNQNGRPDDVDIREELLSDHDENGYPDEGEPDASRIRRFDAYAGRGVVDVKLETGFEEGTGLYLRLGDRNTLVTIDGSGSGYAQLEPAHGESEVSIVGAPGLTARIKNTEITRFENTQSGTSIALDRNPSARVEFSVDIAEPGPVQVRIFDMNGRLVRRLLDTRLSEGKQSLQWDGRDDRSRPSPSGIYLVRVDTEVGALQQRITLLK